MARAPSVQPAVEDGMARLILGTMGEVLESDYLAGEKFPVVPTALLFVVSEAGCGNTESHSRPQALVAADERANHRLMEPDFPNGLSGPFDLAHS
ncbi:hypothetical protein WP1_203 [Pseudomonas phage WP1]